MLDSGPTNIYSDNGGIMCAKNESLVRCFWPFITKHTSMLTDCVCAGVTRTICALASSHRPTRGYSWLFENLPLFPSSPWRLLQTAEWSWLMSRYTQRLIMRHTEADSCNRKCLGTLTPVTAIHGKHFSSAIHNSLAAMILRAALGIMDIKPSLDLTLVPCA